MTGAELAAIRKSAGLSQTDLARRVGIGRHAVSYWECKPTVDRRAWAVQRMAKVLPLPAVPERFANDRQDRLRARRAAQEAAFLAMVQARRDAATAKRRSRCGARTRKGRPCRMKSEPGKRRCKFHGGMSTGARTPEGKARIAEAQRRRWEKWRAERNHSTDPAVTPRIVVADNART